MTQLLRIDCIIVNTRMLLVTVICENSGKDHRGAAGPEYGGIRYI